MSAEPWKKWTPEHLLNSADFAWREGFGEVADMLQAFTALLEAEQRGERCVLPVEVAGNWLMTCKPNNWCADIGDRPEIGQGETQEAAILDLARKLRAR